MISKKNSIYDLICAYDIILFDAYGVLVTGATSLPGANALITKLNQEKKIIT